MDAIYVTKTQKRINEINERLLSANGELLNATELRDKLKNTDLQDIEHAKRVLVRFDCNNGLIEQLTDEINDLQNELRDLRG
jgi:hypothetical protein